MLSFVKSLFNRDNKSEDWMQKHGCSINEKGEIVYKNKAVQQYPPFAEGFKAVPAEIVLKTQQRQVNNIYDALEFTREDFDRIVIPVFKNFIAYVHLLPASERHHHRTQGGMAHHCLEAAFNAAQISRAQIFSTGSTVREKRDNEERWRVAAMLSGLLHDLGKPATDYTVINEKGEHRWLPYVESLEEWFVKNNIETYYLQWNAQRHKKHEQHASLVLYRILTKEMISYLCLHGTEILQAIDSAISGREINKPLARIMMEADQTSVAIDLKRNQIEGASSGLGVPVERYIFDAIRDLISSQAWSVNKVGSRVWHIKGEGAFIDLTKGEAELYGAIQKNKIPGVPRRADTIADLLTERGYAVGSPTLTEGVFDRYWTVEVKVQSDRGSTLVPMKLLKLDSPELIFSGEYPIPAEGKVEHVEPKELASSKAGSSSTTTQKKTTQKPAKENTESTIVNEEKPRDFNQLMDDLAKVEGEHQPDLHSESAGTESPAAPDSTETSKGDNLNSEKAEDHPKDAATDIIEKLSERIRLERDKAGKSTPGQPASEGDPGTTVASKTSTADSISLAPSSSTTSSVKPAVNQAAKKKPKAKPKAKPKSTEEEIAAEAKKMEVEKIKAQRNSALEINPAGVQGLLSDKVEAKPESSKERTSLGFLSPSDDREAGNFKPKAAPSKPKLKLGPGPSQKLSEPLPVTGPIKPKMPPAGLAKPEKAEKTAPKQSLKEKLVGTFGYTAEKGLAVLAEETERIVNREVPLGVTIQMQGEVYRVEPGVLSEETIKSLCSEADCDIDTDGALILGEKLSKIIHSEIKAAEQRAMSELNQDSTGNVTYQEQHEEEGDAEYTQIQITAVCVIEELLEQLNAQGGDMVAPNYRVIDGVAHVNANQTQALIKNKYPHISSNDIRKAMRTKRLLFRDSNYQYVLKELT